MANGNHVSIFVVSDNSIPDLGDGVRIGEDVGVSALVEVGADGAGENVA